MARMTGTGTDALYRYSDGLVFDVPDPQTQSFVDDGLATLAEEEEVNLLAVAQATVRGDYANLPQVAPVDLSKDAHVIVHSNDVNATASDARVAAAVAAVEVPEEPEVKAPKEETKKASHKSETSK